VRSRSTVVALACACVILVIGPFALTLMRAEDYSSSADIAFSDPALAREVPRAESLVADPLMLRDLQRNIARRVEWLERADDVPEHVSVTQVDGADGPAYRVVARGAGPEEARALAEAAAEQLTLAAETAAQFVVQEKLQTLVRQLRRGDVPAGELAASRARRDELESRVESGARVFDESPSPATLAEERAADSFVGALPGERSIRPNPLWAGLAGVALALALLFWVLVLGSIGGRARGSAPG
jgi:hypothetical protein